MNIITNGDVKKFLLLLKAGLKHGKFKEMRNYDSTTFFAGTTVPKSHYVSLEFRFEVEHEIIDKLFIEEDYDASSQINDLLKGL